MDSLLSESLVSANLSSPPAHNDNKQPNMLLHIEDEEICKNKQFVVHISSVPGSPIQIIAFDKRKCTIIYDKESIKIIFKFTSKYSINY